MLFAKPMLDAPPSAEPPSDRPAALPKWEIGLADFGIFIALLLCCMVVGSSLGAYLAQLLAVPVTEGSEPSLTIILASNLGMQAGLLVAYLSFQHITRESGTLRRGRPADAPNPIRSALKWLLIAYPLMFILGGLWQWGLSELGYEPVVQEPVRLVQEGGTLAESIFLYAMIVVVAPVCEELVFRGGIFRFLHHRFPLALATGVSALFFAMIHFNLHSFLPLMILGVALAMAYRESGSVFSSIFLHAVFNSVSLGYILFAKLLPT